jgi:hypothetical protein
MRTAEEKRLKHNARAVNSHHVRLQWMREGIACCVVCNWGGPKSLRGKYGLVEAHHMRGVRTSDLIHDINYQVPLCPNHHKIAETAWPERSWAYNAPPRSREELIKRLREFDQADSK